MRRWIAAAAALFGVSCGYVGEPLYPALNIPSRITDLGAVERAGNILIAFTIPPLTTEGIALQGVSRVQVRVGEREIDVPGPHGPGQVQAAVPVADFAGRKVAIAARAFSRKGRPSEWSNQVELKIEPPVPAPGAVRAEAAAEGVRVSWTGPAGASYRVYRGKEQLATVQTTHYVDTTAEYGKTYEYLVQAVQGQAESEPAAAPPITPKDVFPPAAPSGVSAVAGVNSIEVAWERNTETDLAEYRVYRDGKLAAASLQAPAYSDKQIESGKVYRYEVAAVDQAGNESARSPAVEATAP